MRGFSETCLSVAKQRLLAKGSGEIRVAVLCRHDLSSLEPGDKIHTYDKIMALAMQTPVILFTPRAHAPRGMESQMEVLQVFPDGVLFWLALILALVMHRNNYDCVYTRDPVLMFYATPMKAFGKTLILEMNGIPSLETQIRRRTHRVRAPSLTPLMCSAICLAEAFAIRCADLILPVTKRMRATIIRDYGANPGKVVVVPNSVDTKIFRPLEDKRTEMRQTLGIGRETVVLYLGTFSARWRMSEQLFWVASDIQRKRSDIMFLVVGSGPLLEEIKAVVGEFAMSDRIRFVGAVDHSLVPSYINASDVYAYDVAGVENELVKKQGLCPTKVLEAMACGRPVIALKEPELEALLRESGGGFSASSLRDMAPLMEKFADSADLARSMGANARRYVESNHDLTRLTRLTVELISEVVSSRRS